MLHGLCGQARRRRRASSHFGHDVGMMSSSSSPVEPASSGGRVSLVLVVDLKRVLDESRPGREGAGALQAKFDEMKAQHEKLRSRGTTERGKREADAAAAAFEADAARALEGERARLRADVLSRCRPIIAALMVERGADVVVDAAAVLASGAAVDVTDDVVKRLG
jgi:Skp family chaperone for outer membrane proteins